MGGDDLDFLISTHIYPDYGMLERDVVNVQPPEGLKPLPHLLTG